MAASFHIAAANSAEPGTGSNRLLVRSAGNSLDARDEQLIIGRWIDPLPFGLGIVVIKKKDSGFVLLSEPTNAKPSNIVIRARGSRRFDYIDSATGDYVVILPDGRLDMRDRQGRISVLNIAPAGAGKSAERTAAVLAERKEALCRSDLDCLAKRNLRNAILLCRSSIQASARWDYQWSAGDKLFGGYRWNAKRTGDVRMIDFYGDHIELQNGFGAWVNYIYVCTYDPVGSRVLRIRLVPGHLD